MATDQSVLKKLSDLALAFAVRLGEDLGRTVSVDWVDLPVVLAGFAEGRAPTTGLGLAEEHGEALTQAGLKSVSSSDPGRSETIVGLAVFLGEAVIGKFGGAWGLRSEGLPVVAGFDDAWALRFNPIQLAHAVVQSPDEMDYTSLLGAIPGWMKQARLGMASLDTEATSEEFQEEFAVLAEMSPTEIAGWVDRQASQFRDLWSERFQENLFFDLPDGVARLESIIPAERFFSSLSESMRRRMACFIGECARRYWRMNDKRASEWRWLEAYDDLGIVVEPANSDDEKAGVEAVFFPYEEIKARLGIDPPDAGLEEAVAQFLKRADNFLERDDRDVDEIEDGPISNIDLQKAIHQASEERQEDIATQEQPKIDTSIWELADGLSINATVFELRRQNLRQAGLNIPDLLVPCRSQIGAGMLPISMVPVEGLFFDNEDELLEILTETTSKIETELKGHSLEVELNVFFMNSVAGAGDLVVFLQKSSLIGGAPKATYFLWSRQPGERPQGPLDEARRASLKLFDPVQMNVRQALFHLRHTGDATRARDLLESSQERAPDNILVLMALCSLHLAIGNQITARGYIQRILEIEPENIEALLLEARFCLEEGVPERSMERLERILELEPEHAETYLVRARVHAASGDLDQALRDIDRGVEIDPQNPEAEQLRQAISQEFND